MDRKSLPHTLSMMVLGALSFWLPDVLFHTYRLSRFDKWDAVRVIFLLPLSFGVTYALTKWWYRNDPSKSVGKPFILGVWLLGGPLMIAAASIAYGHFLDAATLFLISFIPLVTFIIATLDGSLTALLLVSTIALLFQSHHRMKLALRSH